MKKKFQFFLVRQYWQLVGWGSCISGLPILLLRRGMGLLWRIGLVQNLRIWNLCNFTLRHCKRFKTKKGENDCMKKGENMVSPQQAERVYFFCRRHCGGKVGFLLLVMGNGLCIYFTHRETWLLEMLSLVQFLL